jgi:hypothetical protein
MAQQKNQRKKPEIWYNAIANRDGRYRLELQLCYSKMVSIAFCRFLSEFYAVLRKTAVQNVTRRRF